MDKEYVMHIAQTIKEQFYRPGYRKRYRQGGIR